MECSRVDFMTAQNRSRQESHLDTFHNQVAGHKGKAAFLKDLDGGMLLFHATMARFLILFPFPRENPETSLPC